MEISYKKKVCSLYFLKLNSERVGFDFHKDYELNWKLFARFDITLHFRIKVKISDKKWQFVICEIDFLPTRCKMDTETLINVISRKPAIWMTKHPQHRYRSVTGALWEEVKKEFPDTEGKSFEDCWLPLWWLHTC